MNSSPRRTCCARCALPLPGNPGAVCGACLRSPPPWDEAVTAFDYAYPVRQLVQRGFSHFRLNNLGHFPLFDGLETALASGPTTVRSTAFS